MCTRESEKNRQKLSRVVDFLHILTDPFLHGSDIIMLRIPHRYLPVIDSIIWWAPVNHRSPPGGGVGGECSVESTFFPL